MAAGSRKIWRSRENSEEDGASERQATSCQLHGATQGKTSSLSVKLYCQGTWEFEVLTAVVMKSTIIWDITPCSPLRVNRRLGGAYRLHLQGRRINRARNHRESSWQADRGLFFDLEDVGHMLLRNVGWHLTDYTTLYPRRYSSTYKQFFTKRRSWVVSACALYSRVPGFKSRFLDPLSWLTSFGTFLSPSRHVLG
jgi:hypothetical protein